MFSNFMSGIMQDSLPIKDTQQLKILAIGMFFHQKL